MDNQIIAMKAAQIITQATKTNVVCGAIADSRVTIVARKNLIACVQEIVQGKFVGATMTVHGLMNVVAQNGAVQQQIVLMNVKTVGNVQKKVIVVKKDQTRKIFVFMNV